MDARLGRALPREIYRYGLLEYGEKQADRYFADCFTRFDQIADNPLLYSAVDHIREGYRSGVCGVHAIGRLALRWTSHQIEGKAEPIGRSCHA